MDGLDLGFLKGGFSSNQNFNEEQESTQRSEHKYDFTSEYTPPDISELTQPIFQKQQKQLNVETLIPVVVQKVLSNINDPNQKLKIFNTPVFGMCIVGKVTNLQKFASMFQFDLEDSTGTIKVHFTKVSVELEDDDYVQIVGSLVLLSLDNFYVDSQHLINLGKYSTFVENRLKFHYVLVSYAAYNLDLSEKLKLQNKHIGKMTDLPGLSSSRNFEEIELGPDYDDVKDDLQLLVLKYLKSSPEYYAKKSSIVDTLVNRYQESSIESAIESLLEQSLVAKSKDFLCLVL